MKKMTLNPGRKRKISHEHFITKIICLKSFLMIATTVICFRTVWVARIAQEPSTAYSGESGFLKFSERERTHFEIIDGHLFSNFIRDFPASLSSTSKFKMKNVTALIIQDYRSYIKLTNQKYAN